MNPTTGDVGVELPVSWGDFVGEGSNRVQFRVVGKFRLLCYYRGVAGETCPTPDAATPDYGSYPEGTIIGVAPGITTSEIDDDTVLGSIISDVQRLLLVR